MSNRLSRYAEGIMEACWLLALLVAPLFFNIYSSRVFEPDKIALVRSLALVALAAWGIKLLALGGWRAADGAADWRRTPLRWPVLALVAAYLISTALSIAPNISLWGSYQRLQGAFSNFSYIVLGTVLVANLRRRAQVERVITLVVVTSLPVSLYGILQRYKLDPLPWGGDTVERVTGHMGNAIFLGAYLIMSSALVLGRVVTSFRAVMTSASDLARHTLRAALYVFIFAVNLVAIWFTQSRGPQLGLLAGLFLFFVLMALFYRIRWLVLTTVALGVLMGAFLITLNIPNGPLKGLASTPGIARLASVFDEIQGNTGTGQVRVLIWTGVVQMMTPHTPLETPDGQPDVWNAIRPLIGYGPEAMLVAYNRFYPPALGDIEARNASPDRSHNETFDALAFTGILGLLAQMSLFVSVFYYSLKWLGMIGSPNRRNVFLGLVLGGGVLSSIAFVTWQGPQFFGVSLPLGMLLGLIAFLTLYALLPTAETGPRREPWQAIAIISLFGAVVAHFAEIHFGIAIVSTRTHFWIFLGLLIVLGYIWPALEAGGQPAAPAAVPTSAPAPAAVRGRRRAAAEPRREAPTLTPVALTLGLMTPLMLTLGFDYITNSARTTSAVSIVTTALTHLTVNGADKVSLGILGLLVLTWLMGGTLVYLEETPEQTGATWLGNLAASLGFTALIAGLLWLIQGGLLASVAAFQPRSVDELQTSVGMVAGILTWYYAFLLIALLIWAAALTLTTAPAARARTELPGTAWLGAVGLPLAAMVLAVLLNLQVIQADVIYKTGMQFDDQGQPAVAVALFKTTLALAPSQDFYYLFLGRSYLNASNSAPADQRDGLFKTAETELFKARDINPLNTDHTANLARLNRQWSALTSDPALRQSRAEASDKYYAQALSLSPHNVGLWNEWALLNMQLLNNLPKAQQYLDQSISLDNKFDQTFWYQGDLLQAQARTVTDTVTQQDLYKKAEAAYQQGVTIVEGGHGASLLNLRLGLANVYVATNQLQPAIDQYLKVAQLNAGAGQWQVYRALGALYQQTGDLAQARAFGQQALTAAPEAEKPNLQAWVDSLPK